MASSVACVLSGLRTIIGRIDDQIAAITGGDDSIDTLSAEGDHREDLQRNAHEWEHYLQRDLAMLRRDAIATLETELTRLREKWTTKINSSNIEVLRRSPQHFVGAIERDLHSIIDTTLDQLATALTPMSPVCSTARTAPRSPGCVPR